VDASQLGAYLPLVLLVVVGYLLLIRPARRRAQATAALQAAISPGDEVMLSSGLFARVVEITDEVAHVELAPDIVVRVHRGAITKVVKDRPSPFSDEPAPGSTKQQSGGEDDAGVT
jgi:preprotein translocase subunit YajC